MSKKKKRAMNTKDKKLKTEKTTEAEAKLETKEESEVAAEKQDEPKEKVEAAVEKQDESKEEAEEAEKQDESKEETEAEAVAEKQDESKEKADVEKKEKDESEAPAEVKEEPEGKADAESSKGPEKNEEVAAATVELEAEPYVIPKEKFKWPTWAKVSAIVVLVVLILYGGGAIYFTNHFMWNTTLNGLDVSMLSGAQAQNKLDTMLKEYKLEIFQRDGDSEFIAGSEIDLNIQYLEHVENVLSQQDVFLWFLSPFLEQDYTLAAQVSYNRISLYQRIDELGCMQKVNIIEPQEPKIIQQNGSFLVQDGDEGRKPIVLEARAVIEKAISDLNVAVDLEQENCYETLEYRADAKEIQEAIEYLETLQDIKITYQFPEEKVILSGDTILDWATISKDYHVTIDRNKVKEYVDYIKETYEIRGQIIDFPTTYGQTVEITSYIWSDEIDTNEEVEEILDMIENAQMNGKTTYQRDASDLASIGDTYIEINLTSQHLYCYKDGKMILETDFVSGLPSMGRATPPGIFTIRYTASPAILVGEDYRTPVSYWMPFNGGIGLHDATWQSAFGGRRYLTNGSHGCINLPLDMAKAIYENYEAGDVVVVYHLAGTESSSASPAGRPSSSPVPVATEAPATEAATEAPAEPTPPATEAPTEAPSTEAPEAVPEIPGESAA